MDQPLDLSSVTALFAGLVLLASGAGELRAPGGWRAILGDLETAPGLRFVAALVSTVAGAMIYLASGWRAGGALPLALAILGAALAMAGLALLAAGDRLLRPAPRLLERGRGAVAGAVALAGLALIAGALARL
jgi:hypothetical protein